MKTLLPLVPEGGIIVLDEVDCEKWKGEKIPLKEQIQLSEIKLQKFYFDPWVSYYAVG